MPHNEEPEFLAGCRVAILGLGLMGGSLALALRGHCLELLGSDPNPSTGEQAIRRQVVDSFSTDPGKILPGSDLVILPRRCAPSWACSATCRGSTRAARS